MLAAQGGLPPDERVHAERMVATLTQAPGSAELGCAPRVTHDVVQGRRLGSRNSLRQTGITKAGGAA
jgi:hypothetical protein